MAKRRARGEGSIFREKSGYWCAKITTSEGVERRKRSKSQRVVREWLQDQRQTIQKNLPPRDETTKYGNFLDRFVENVVIPTLAASTIRSYKYLIRDHIKPELGHIKLADLKPHHIQSLYQKKLDAGLSERTVQYIHAVIRRSLNHAVKSGRLHFSPAAGVVAPRPKKNPPTTLSVDQANP